jgi:hypothetical protein
MSNQERMFFTLDIIKVGRKRIDVSASLTVQGLLDKVRDRWNLSEPYVLSTSDARGTDLPTDQPLSSLGSSGVHNGAVLICRPSPKQSSITALIQDGRRIKLSRVYRSISLIEPRSQTEYAIQWQPAVIGRKDTKEDARNQLLAVDLTTLDPASSVSRHHACITENNGIFSVEVLQNHNPLYVSDRRLVPGQQVALTTNSALRLGSLQLIFRITE